MLQVAVSNVPGANDLPVRQNRQLVDKQIKSYSELTRKVEDDLRLAFTYRQLPGTLKGYYY